MNILRTLRQGKTAITTAQHVLSKSQTCWFTSLSGVSYSHDNPLGLPTKNRNKLLPDHDARPGIPSSKLPPKLNISRSIPQKRKINNVQKVLVVASGKGGVGKSTVAVNLAISIKNQSNLKVGLLDLDIFGPSIPKLMGLDDGIAPELTQGLNTFDLSPYRLPHQSNNIDYEKENALIPLRNHGISCMSIGFLIPSEKDSDQMIAWRGMMVMKAVQQLLFDVDWRTRDERYQSGLDVLVIDMPPGTGDVALSLGQLVEIDGAVIVTTPQDIALIDVTKGVNMFRKLNIPIIGSIVNMSSFKCTSCKTNHEIFGPLKNFYEILSRHSIPLLGQIPLDVKISKLSDLGKPMSIYNDINLTGLEEDKNSNNNKDDQVNPFIQISKKCLNHLDTHL